MKTLKNIMGLTFVMSLLILFSTSCKDEPKGPTDAEIANIVVVANQIDVDYGKLALEKSKNEMVRKFAETMINDHNNIIKSASDLVGQLGVTPKDNPTSQSLLDGQKEVLNTLKGLQGKDFDKAYMENEVSYHEAVIAAVKNTLIPSASNEQLKQALVDVSPLLDHHLEMAKIEEAKVAKGEGYPTEYSDPQIASIVVVANQIDVEYGEIALKKSQNETVRKFAQTMINDHNNIIQAASDLAGKLGVTPDGNNDLTKALLAGAQQTKDKLNSLSGAEFNKAYMNNEVDYHDAVINAVKDILIPQTDNNELKQALIDVSPLLDHHLRMARDGAAQFN